MTAGIGWRLIYGIGIVLFNLISGNASLLSTSLSSFILSFVLLQGMVNAFFIYPVFSLKKMRTLSGRLVTKPGFAILSLMAAVSIELLSHII